MGPWLKQRRPRVPIERIDADLITRYLAGCSSFRAKATVYGTLSTMRWMYGTHLWVTVLSLLNGTGLRRGELERLNMDAFDRAAGTLRIDGRKSGQERRVPLPEMELPCLEAHFPRRHNQLERFGQLGEAAFLVSRGGSRLTGEHISNAVHGIESFVRRSIVWPTISDVGKSTYSCCHHYFSRYVV
jgi:integrase